MTALHKNAKKQVLPESAVTNPHPGNAVADNPGLHIPLQHATATAVVRPAGRCLGRCPAFGLCHDWQVLMQGEVEEVEHKLTEAENSRGQLRRFCTKFCTPVFLEAFVLTFLAGG